MKHAIVHSGWFRRHAEAFATVANNGMSAILGLVALCLIATTAYRATEAMTVTPASITSASADAVAHARLPTPMAYP